MREMTNTRIPQLCGEAIHDTQPGAQARAAAGFFAAAFGVVTRPWMTIERLSLVPHTSAWSPAVLALAIVIVRRIVYSHANSLYLYADQVAYYAEHPDRAPMGGVTLVTPPIMTVGIQTGEELGKLLASWVLWASVVYLISLLVSRGRSSLRTAVTLTLWSWLPYIIRGVLQSGYMLLVREPIFNPGLSSLLLDNTPPSQGEYSYVMVP